MIARWRSLVVGTILALLAGNSLRAEEPRVVESRGGLFVRFVSYSRPAAPTTRSSTSTATAAPRQDPQQPALSPAPQSAQPAPSAPAASTQLQSNVFGSGAVQSSQLAQSRRDRASATSSDIVLGRESGFRAASDAGSLLGKSNQTRGVASQKRSPIITDTRVRGAGVGSLTVGG